MFLFGFEQSPAEYFWESLVVKVKEKARITPALKRCKYIFDIIKHTTDAYIFCLDVKNEVIMLSPNMVQDFDLPSEIMASSESHWLNLIHPDDVAACTDLYRQIFTKENVFNFAMDYRVKDRKGNYVWIRYRGRMGNSQKDADGAKIFAGTLVRMAARNQADEVTGLLNKNLFEHALKMALKNAAVTGEHGAVIYLGADNFKLINETHNRIVGDECLRRLSRIVENLLPPMLMAYKLDGDVFGIIFPDADEERVNEFYTDVQRSLAKPIVIDGRQCFCTMSAGTIFYPQSGKDWLNMLKHAEAALDFAKRGGKNRNVIFNKEEYNRWVRSVSIRDWLADSVAADCRDFELYFQPQVDAKTMKLLGAEALLRWFNPKGKMVAPMEFVPMLEETKLILPVGKWILEQAVRVCRKIRRVVPDFKMSVNLSYDQIKDGGFREFVTDCLARWQMPPESLVLELTESRIVADWHYVNREFDKFREMGISIAMDDFGTGYSSLATFKNLSCDIVKIDREFVRDIETSEFDRRLVKYAVNLCHSKNMRACIEGVEEENAYRILTEEVGADYIQGYLFGRPEPLPQFEEKFLRSECLSPQKT